MFQRFGGDAGNLVHLRRIEADLRRRFGLRAADIVLVSEEAPGLPGFPGTQTTARFWDAQGRRYRLRVFKPAAEVGPADMPPAFLLPALIDDGDPDCC